VPDEKPDALRGRSILIVEDEYMIATDTAQSVEQLGAAVIGPVGSVAEALALAASAPTIDAAVLDVNLRGEKVFPVADALRARGVPFVLATGYDEWVIPAEYAGTPRCEKPVDAHILVRLLSP